MADLFSPMKFDEAQCKVKAAGTGDAIDPKHIAVDPSADNIITNDPQTGLKVVAEDFISAEEGNIAKKSLADGGILVKATDMVSDAECNALSVTNDGKLALIPEDLISDVMGGNPLGINPDDCKLYINPCLLPGPQNIVSKDEDNLIVEDPEDCSALLKFENVVSEDRGNLIIEGSDGKLSVQFQDIVDKDYFGAGLVYVERQDGSKVLQVAACDGLTFQQGTKTDVRGNTYTAKWLTINLDEGQNLLYFVNSNDECTECFEGCGELTIEFSLNANGEKLRILDRSGNVYKQINLSNGLQGDGSGGLTINTQDTIATTSPNDDKPISSKAVSAFAAPKYHANADKTIYGGGTGTLYGHVKLTDSLTDGTNCKDSSVALSACAGKALKDMIDAIDTTQFAPIPHDSTATTYGAGSGTKYGHVKLSASHTSDLGVGDGTAATPSAVKKAYDDGTRKGTCDTFGQVKLTDSLTSTSGCASSIGLSAAAGKQLKDLIDEIIDSGGGEGALVRYPLFAKDFVARYDNNRENVIYGKVVAPSFGNSSTRFATFIESINLEVGSGENSGEYSFGLATRSPYPTINLTRGAQAKYLLETNNVSIANGVKDAGVMINAITLSANQMENIADALNAIAPIPLPTLAKYYFTASSDTYYFQLCPYNPSSLYVGITIDAPMARNLSYQQLVYSCAVQMVKPDVSILTIA